MQNQPNDVITLLSQIIDMDKLAVLLGKKDVEKIDVPDKPVKKTRLEKEREIHQKFEKKFRDRLRRR